MTQDDAAFREFVSASSPRLLRTAFLLVGQAHAAEDLLQDVLEKLYVKWTKVSEPEAYARRALVNGAANRWRSKARRPETALLARHDRPVEDLRPDSGSALMSALASLPHGQRAVVVLRYFEDLSVEQVASHLGCSTGTVKSQTARALPRLRHLLTSDLVLDEEICP